MRRARRFLTVLVVSLVVLLALGAVVLPRLPYRESPQDQRFYFPVKQLDPIPVAHEDVWLRTPDGLKLAMLRLPPAGAPKATLLCLHGAGGNASRYVKLARPLVDAGYQVFILDWRGYGSSEGTPGHRQVLEDSQLALDSVLARADVKGQPVLLWGLSLGGQVAIELARRNEGRLAGLVTEGAVSSFADVAADHSPAWMRPMLAMVVKGPYEAKEAIAQLAHTPKLLIQSHDDRDVRFARGQELYARAQEPKSFWEIDGEHLYGTQRHGAEYVRRLDALVAQARASR
ncbi:alpha/beta fold hydrolase [Aggregicoccus sp. 17bor-14]|uniref:alpha/beta hydrolase n=1 Tax=Myxococcaceae TaxID=31 RepID=UPI00129C1204|nr:MULTISPECIES: alpha/beta fold hydrolase [Myxococcaceae]MBF5046614.1 alpha/beta fold hydrolase [Simulacricoccus sp. 17bor-14]MRI92324.1 alpha/beta fold hydrolase [Aggregicoccus sp. 17bor-14]